MEQLPDEPHIANVLRTGEPDKPIKWPDDVFSLPDEEFQKYIRPRLTVAKGDICQQEQS